MVGGGGEILQAAASVNRMKSDKEITVKILPHLQSSELFFFLLLFFIFEKDNERGSLKPHFHWCSNTQLLDLRTGGDQREWFSFR